ncbi:hypothetical protein TcWFU_003696 [Taenia crassiceps]|uniref:Uncharacterized protein n=1 Tax=Taenia crassiceps TaxID=6207 RepID=A0ABR4Q2Q3_9CEST
MEKSGKDLFLREGFTSSWDRHRECEENLGFSYHVESDDEVGSLQNLRSGRGPSWIRSLNLSTSTPFALSLFYNNSYGVRPGLSVVAFQLLVSAYQALLHGGR